MLWPLLSDSSALSGSHITTPLGLPESLGGLGEGQHSNGGGQSQQPTVIQIHQPQEGHICAFNHLRSGKEKREPTPRELMYSCCGGQGSSAGLGPDHCMAALELRTAQAACKHTPVQCWACSTPPVSAVQLTTGKSCLLCAAMSGADKSLGMMLGESFSPSVFCLVQHLDQDIHFQWDLFSVISVHLC